MSIIDYHNYNPNKKYKFGCVIGTFNRHELLQETIESLNNSFLPEDLLFVIVDDCSDNTLDIKLKRDYIVIRKNSNSGIASSLAIGWDLLYFLDIDFLINLDSDTLVSNNWLSVLFNVHENISEQKTKCIVTGFNSCMTHVHKTINSFTQYNEKSSIGGINLFFSKDLYGIVRLSLTDFKYTITSIQDIIINIDRYGKNPKIHPIYNGWDWGLMELCVQNNIKLFSSIRSVVQHTGTFGLTSSPQYFDHSLDYQNTKVPKIIHQLWKNNDIPNHLLIMQKTVKDLHPDYEYKFWTDDSLEQFIGEYHPGLKKFYKYKFQYNIQKIDFVRLLLLYHYGGIYIDLDSYCLKNMDELLSYPCTLVVTEKHSAFYEKYYPIVLNNAIIVAEPFNNFIRSNILHIMNYQHPSDYTEFCSFNPEYIKVLKMAGPLCITDVYNNYQYKSLINLITSKNYKGINSYNKNNIMDVVIEHKEKLDSDHLYALHLHESSWWRENGESVLPPPNKKYKPNFNDESKL